MFEGHLLLDVFQYNRYDLLCTVLVKKKNNGEGGGGDYQAFSSICNFFQLSPLCLTVHDSAKVALQRLNHLDVCDFK